MSKMAFYFSRNCSLISTRIPSEDENAVFPKLQDVWTQVCLTLAVLILRYFSRKYIFTPLGKSLKIIDTKCKPVPRNDVLEAAYNKSTKCKDAASLAKQSDLTARQVERWWRLRRRQDRPSTLVKFTENMWKGIFVLCNSSFGLYVLWDKEWFWNMDEITKGVNSGIPSGIWWYYMISSTFFWSLTLTLFWDVRRKDFWQMFVHHIATNVLLTLSWFANIHRIGSVVLVLHDSSDIVLELGKAAKSARMRGITAVFALFVVTWTASRLILFPYWVLTRTSVQAYVCNVLLIHLLNGMLWFLLVLHVIWTWTILQVAYKTTTSGKEPDDIRSSSSESEESDSKLRKRINNNNK